MNAPEHSPQGNPCQKCSLPADKHRKRDRSSLRADYFALYRASEAGIESTNQYHKSEKGKKAHSAARRRYKQAHPVIKTIVGIDGEGWTDHKGKHHYSYLAACSAEKLISDIYEPNGLRSEQIFDFSFGITQRFSHCWLFDWIRYYQVDAKHGSCIHLLSQSPRGTASRRR